MADTAENKSTSVVITEEKLKNNVYRSYNYVGNKETLAYLLNDVSNAFNIGYGERYMLDVVKIDLGLRAIIGLFTSAWDIINDTFIAAIVDNTRTRIGKFRPYLVFMQIPLSLFGLLYWFIPYMFPNALATYMPKIIFFYIFSVIQETAGTFTGVAKSGYMSTITPNPNERVRLITLAELLSGYMGEDMPRYIFGTMFDMVNTGRLSMSLRSLFMVGGVSTSVVSSLFTFWFFLKSKERVPQSLEHPDFKEGFKAIFSNYPVLLMCLSSFLGGFSIGTGEDNYWIDVFGKDSMINLLKTLVSAISAPIGSISYAFVKPARKRFSSKFLWVATDLYDDMLKFGFFFWGFFNKNYLKLKPMLVYFGIREFMVKLLFGVNKVVLADLWNQAMDYCEWKNGYRMEATTGVASSLVLKIQGSIMGSINSFVMKKVGYDLTQPIGAQSEKTKFWLFALCSVVPVITSALGIVPKLLWPLSKKRTAQMYYELSERRNQVVSGYVASVTEESEAGEE